jgi:hypothetical protein
MGKILSFFSENPEATQAIAKSVPAIMGMFQASSARNAMEGYQTKLDNIEKSRQQIVNPYANVTNPFANMQVATKAAEMQAEQTDMALANTLDTLRETGASAGGATAIAQAALRSKQGISASIEKQESKNQMLAAQGQQRMEIAQGQGKQAMFNMQENRDVRDINRLQMNMDAAQMQRAAGVSTAALSAASGIAGLSGLIKPEERDTETGFLEDYDPAKARSTISMDGQSGDDTIEEQDVGLTLDIKEDNGSLDFGNYTADQFLNPNAKYAWGQNITGMEVEREKLRKKGESTVQIQNLINATRKKIGA